MNSGSDSFVSGSFDAYTPGAIPVIKNVVSGTGSSVVVETLDQYQVAMRKSIEEMFGRSTGQYMTLGGA